MHQSGTLTIYKAGKPFGTESFQLSFKNDEIRSHCSVSLNLPGGFTQEVELHFQPANSPRYLRVDFVADGKRAERTIEFLEGTARVETTSDSKSVVNELPVQGVELVLASNTFHHFLLFVLRYDFEKSGKQQFHLFPSKSAVLEGERIFLNDAGDVVQKLFVDIEGVVGVRVVCVNDRLVRVIVPIQRVEALAEDSPELELLNNFEKTLASDKEETEELGISEQEVFFTSFDRVKLAGTLSLPTTDETLKPAVLLISGSGPQDRNNDTVGPGGIHLGMFRTIATRLTDAGVAVLRYDDRGVAQSEGEFRSAGLFDLANDARSGVEFLKNHPAIDNKRIALVGHSEGALIATIIGSTTADINCIVVMGMAAQSLDEVLLWQFQQMATRLYSPDAVKAAVARRRKSLETIKTTGNWDSEDVEDTLRKSVPTPGRKWFGEHFSVNPAELIQRLKIPVAIFVGSNDFQIDPKDAKRLSSALEEVGHQNHTLIVFSGLDHLFTHSTGPNLSEYAIENRELGDQFLTSLVEWLSNTLEVRSDN